MMSILAEFFSTFPEFVRVWDKEIQCFIVYGLDERYIQLKHQVFQVIITKSVSTARAKLYFSIIGAKHFFA